MAKQILLVLSMLLLTSGAFADECYERWMTEILLLQPRPDDTVDKRTGRFLSQTDGAKRTRGRKLQALKDELELRGRKDARWLMYQSKCEMK